MDTEQLLEDLKRFFNARNLHTALEHNELKGWTLECWDDNGNTFEFTQQ